MSRRRWVATLAAALLVVAAGCSSVGFGFGPRGAPPGGDTIGFEDGYWYDDPLNVTADDGFNETERRAVVARTMARVEVIREVEFQKRVPVEVVSRQEYQSDDSPGGPSGSATYEAWNNQVWEALLLVSERQNVSDAFGTVYGSSVQGFYSPSKDEIVLVSDSETPTVDTRTLAHELVHALQDQQFTLSGGAATQDGQLAEDGLIEGDANLVEDRYDERCGNDWQCIEPPSSRSSTPADFNFGVFLTVFTPYAEGPDLVADLVDRGGGDWEQVNAAYDALPQSTEQVIHPEKYPDDAPTNVSVRDRSSDGWHRFDLDQQTDTVGEASIYATFWATEQIDHSRTPYNYSHPLSAGWDGDTLVPYTNGSHGGYVWKLTFDSDADAREFRRGYVGALDSKGASSPSKNVFVVPESNPYADAFRVTRRGDTVVVVNAPTTEDLSKVHG